MEPGHPSRLKAEKLDNYQRKDSFTYYAIEPGGKIMLVYFSKARKIICCGDKE